MAEDETSLPYDFGPLLLVSFLLGIANAISHGTYLAPALGIIVVALVVLAWRFIGSPRKEHAPESRVGLIARLLVVGLVALQVAALFDRKVVPDPHGSTTLVRAAEIGACLLLLSYVPFLGARRETRRMRDARFIGFALLVVVAGACTIHATPGPTIDVWTIQMRGAEALLHGENPYVTATVEDTDPENAFVVPYVYPPTAIYVGAICLALGRDVRWAMLVAMVVTGFALRWISRSKLPSIFEDAPALFYWLTPLLVFVLECSWLDPLQVMLITVGLAAHVGKRPIASAIVFGIAASSKQSMFWLVPLVMFVLGQKLREWIVMGIAALAPLLPFMILDLERLKFCLFDFMSALPPRSDALDVWVFFKRTFGLPFPAASGFVLAALAVAFALFRMRRSIDGFARAVVITYLVFFLFNRWAFANYYFLLTGLSALAAAATLAASPKMRYAGRP